MAGHGNLPQKKPRGRFGLCYGPPSCQAFDSLAGCEIDGRYSLQANGEILLLTDNDGEEAAAEVTTVAFWSGMLEPSDVLVCR